MAQAHIEKFGSTPQQLVTGLGAGTIIKVAINEFADD
jgi:hypothetical protein